MIDLYVEKILTSFKIKFLSLDNYTYFINLKKADKFKIQSTLIKPYPLCLVSHIRCRSLLPTRSNNSIALPLAVSPTSNSGPTQEGQPLLQGQFRSSTSAPSMVGRGSLNSLKLNPTPPGKLSYT